MEILSSARSTFLLDFNNLNKICSYENSLNESTDFHFFRDKNVFTQINKKNGLEFLQIRKSIAPEVTQNEEYSIKKLFKMKIENLHCVAPLEAYEIALGMSNGEIRILNYKSNDYISKFPAETSKHSVINLDYSNIDEYLASVYENGLINIYGMKTKAKLETINLDGNSTVARFNPKKKFRLAVASYKGSVFLYDVHAKRKIFQAVESHTAPCRDIGMSENMPDILYSAGYDSVINIFDVKKRSRIHQIKFRYPLSTISISECGQYCCSGNLKGEIITHDLRNLKKSLKEKKVHDSAVIRVAFVPPATPNQRRSSIFPSQLHDENSTQTIQNENSSKRDSFFDFIEFHNINMRRRNNNQNASEVNSLLERRESFDWDQLATKKVTDTEKRMSNRFSLNFMKKRLTGEYSPAGRMPLTEKNSQIPESSTNNHNAIQLLSKTSKINEVDEEETSQINNKEKDEVINETNLPENNEVSINNDDVFLKTHHKNTKSSTPNRVYFNDNNQEIENAPNFQSRSSNDDNSTSLNIELLNQIKDLRLEMDKKFNNVECEIKCHTESVKWNLYNSMFSFWKDQHKINSVVCDSLSVLLHSDDFIQDYNRLQAENEELKMTVAQLRKRNSF